MGRPCHVPVTSSFVASKLVILVVCCAFVACMKLRGQCFEGNRSQGYIQKYSFAMNT